MSKHSLRLLHLIIISVWVPSQAWSTSFVRPTDRALIESSPIVLQAEVLAVQGETEKDPSASRYVVQVQNVVKGHVPGSVVVINVPGEISEDGSFYTVFGTPRLRPGQQALLLVSPDREDTFKVDQLALGVFHQIEVEHQKYLIRDLSEMLELHPHAVGRSRLDRAVDEPRDAEKFVEWISASATGDSIEADYRPALSSRRHKKIREELLIRRRSSHNFGKGAAARFNATLADDNRDRNIEFLDSYLDLAGIRGDRAQVAARSSSDVPEVLLHPGKDRRSRAEDLNGTPAATSALADRLVHTYNCELGGLASLTAIRFRENQSNSEASGRSPELSARHDFVLPGTSCIRNLLEASKIAEVMIETEALRDLSEFGSGDGYSVTASNSQSRSSNLSEPPTTITGTANSVERSGPGPLARGYQPKACGFDLDDDFNYGESGDDCNICNGVETDPDGDGKLEDIFYVDCDSGTNNGSCGSPGSPCRTIGYAWSSRANGPASGKEDIICFTGVCSAEPDPILTDKSGVAATKTRSAQGNEVRSFDYPKDPLMLVGWDTDNDGIYPPLDGDDVSVIDGSGKRLAFENDGEDYLEIAHFTVRNYGRQSSGWQGFWRFTEQQKYVYFHDLELENIMKDQCYDGKAKVFSNGPTQQQSVAIENLKCTDCASFFVRGGAGVGGSAGPLRLQNVTHICHAADEPSCGDPGAAKCRLVDIWGYMSGVEILDSLWDANLGAWDEHGASQAGISMAQCSQDWDIVNNEFVDWRVPITVEFSDNTFCNPGRLTHDLVVDRNIAHVTGPTDLPNTFFLKFHRDGGEGSNRLGNVSVTNNLYYTANNQPAAAFIAGEIGNNEIAQAGVITVANNTFVVDDWGANFKAFMQVDIPPTAARQQNFVVKNNLISGPIGGDNLDLEYAPTGWDADFNSFDPDMGYRWLEGQRYNLVNWRALSGGDTNSNECIPLFEDPGSGDFHLRVGDTCAKDTGTDLTGLVTSDLDGDPRGQGQGWDRGADEFSESGPTNYTLTVSRSGSGSGSVTSTPGGINCGSNCSESYLDGTAVTLSAVPAPDSVLAGWSGHSDCSDGQLTMSSNRNCTATFQLNSAPTVVITQPEGNIAAGVPVSSSGNEFPSRDPEQIVDGLVDLPDSHWAAQGTPSWVELDLGRDHIIDTIFIAPFAGSPGNNYFYNESWRIKFRDPTGTLQHFSNVQQLAGAGTLTGSGISVTGGDPGSTSSLDAYKYYEFSFDPEEVRFVRFTVTEGDRDGDSNGSEIEIAPVFPAGSNLSLGGYALDPEEGNISSNLLWTSSIDNDIGTGGLVTTNSLSTGTHVITASVEDSGGLSGVATTQIVVVDTDPRDPSFSDGFESGDSSSWSSVAP